MKIYFAGSIRGGRIDQDTYFSIIQELTTYGTVLTEHIGNLSLDDGGEKHLTSVEIYERDMAWLREADVVIAEVSTPSLGVGYELGQAESIGKPILCLYRKNEEKKLSAMIGGNKDMDVYEYEDLTTLFSKLHQFFDDLGISK